MKFKSFAAAILAAVLIFSLAACGTVLPADAPDQEPAPTQQAEQPEATEAPAVESEAPAETSSSPEEAWKVDFEKSLLENYGVTPDHYEDLGDGIYQVYVVIDGNTVPYVTVDSATGDYHG